MSIRDNRLQVFQTTFSSCEIQTLLLARFHRMLCERTHMDFRGTGGVSKWQLSQSKPRPKVGVELALLLFVSLLSESGSRVLFDTATLSASRSSIVTIIIATSAQAGLGSRRITSGRLCSHRGLKPPTAAMSFSDAGIVGLAGVVIRDIVSPSPSTPTPVATPSPVIGAPEVDGDNCKLMGPFALFVQAMMGILVVGSLVYKRQREKPKRKWKIWALDVSKQMLGQLFVHILNVVLSDFVASGGGENPCSLYFLNILVDTTLGVFFIYIALKYVTWFLTERMGLEGFVSGQYTPPLPAIVPASSGDSTSSAQTGAARRAFRRGRPRIEYWLKQLASYLFVLLLMKMAVLVIFALFPFLFDVGSWILGFFGNHKQFQVLFSMALFPLAMNVLQFWLIDSLLRHNPYTSAYSKVNPDDQDFPNSSDRISHDSRRSDQDGHGGAHSIGEASDDEQDDLDGRRIQPHGSGSSKSRRRPSPQRSQATSDQPYNYPPPTDLYGSVHKSPPLRASRPTDEMRRQASLTLSDAGSDQDSASQSMYQPSSNSRASMQRSESHHLKQVGADA